VFGSQNGKRIRKALDTSSWERGEEILRGLDPEESPETISLETACDRFIEDCKSRHLAKETIGKYELLTRELKASFKGMGVKAVSSDDLARYRESWEMSAVSSRKKLERLKALFRFCMDRAYRRGNPAASLRPPVGRHKPTMPITKDDFDKLEWACELFSAKGIYGKDNRIRVRAFLLLLRYSGLRIRDAVLLTDDKLTDNKLLLYSAKTGVPVYLPLPERVVEQLKWAYELSQGKYYFWSGAGEIKSAVNDWQRTLSRLSELAGVKFHAHQLRDTFAVELLQKGVSLENVATLLGNSVRIAEKHYAPWVKSRQDSLSAEIEKAWKL
jgi:integrase/recombinase XerD